MDSLESRNLRKIEEREGLYSKNRPLFICTARVRQGRSVNSLSGITLIALVVTIVVLLILTSVSITVVFGDNGILQLAKEAGEKTNEAKDKDLRQIAMAEAAMNFENKEYKGATIPAGFAPTKIEGEDSIEEGLVIIDSKGNEFVWIPCGTYDEDTKQYSTTDYENAGNYSKSSSGKNWKSSCYDTGDGAKTGWSNKTVNNDDQTEIAKTSIQKYGGFYIARYEGGIPEEASFYASKDGDNYYTSATGWPDDTVLYKDGTNYIPVSKRGYPVWNFISQTSAKVVAEKMYATNSKVNSYLIDSNAWNYICYNIFDNKLHIDLLDSKNYGNYATTPKKYYEGITGLFAKHAVDPQKWTIANTYSYGTIPVDAIPESYDSKGGPRLELAAGLCESFKLYNIYDMAGNLAEWTCESCTLTDGGVYSTLRGGSFHSVFSGGDPTVTEIFGGYGIGNSWVDYGGIRVVLYVK